MSDNPVIGRRKVNSGNGIGKLGIGIIDKRFDTNKIISSIVMSENGIISQDMKSDNGSKIKPKLRNGAVIPEISIFSAKFNSLTYFIILSINILGRLTYSAP